MNNIKETELRRSGFRPVSNYPVIWVNSKGMVYNSRTGNYIKPNEKNLIFLSGAGYISVPKAMLQEFKNERMRQKGHITYIDGNSCNLHIDNIRYNRLFENEPDRLRVQNLILAIRHYYYVEPDFTVKGPLYRTYLKGMAEQTGYGTSTGKPHNHIFTTYINQTSLSLAEVAEMHNVSVRDCAHIVNSGINDMADHVLKEHKGISINPFLNKRTKGQALKEWNNYKDGITGMPNNADPGKEPLTDWTEFIKGVKNG